MGSNCRIMGSNYRKINFGKLDHKLDIKTNPLEPHFLVEFHVADICKIENYQNVGRWCLSEFSDGTRDKEIRTGSFQYCTGTIHSNGDLQHSLAQSPVYTK